MSDANVTTPRVFIARHGETEWTILGQFTGNADMALTENGIRQSIGKAERALVTLDSLLGQDAKEKLQAENKVTITEDITEWDYGNYEGKIPAQINELRAEQGLSKWNIWVEGCEGGESASEVQERLDELIGKIKKIQEPFVNCGDAPDVLVVAHGHILHAFVKRWLQYDMAVPFTMMMEPGAIGVLSYAHHNIDEPAILAGMAFETTK
ncbi:phosphoglycerate mutase [Diaporthe sp. PMI_573]|nr:phosphoglycerate mutase [Diaporthaceae sp. PMI_573]